MLSPMPVKIAMYAKQRQLDSIIGIKLALPITNAPIIIIVQLVHQYTSIVNNGAKIIQVSGFIMVMTPYMLPSPRVCSIYLGSIESKYPYADEQPRVAITKNRYLQKLLVINMLRRISPLECCDPVTLTSFPPEASTSISLMNIHRKSATKHIIAPYNAICRYLLINSTCDPCSIASIIPNPAACASCNATKQRENAIGLDFSSAYLRGAMVPAVTANAPERGIINIRLMNSGTTCVEKANSMPPKHARKTEILVLILTPHLSTTVPKSIEQKERAPPIAPNTYPASASEYPNSYVRKKGVISQIPNMRYYYANITIYTNQRSLGMSVRPIRAQLK